MEDTTFTGTIKVASRIIDYLSSGLYNSPGACLKELINNSYDADATRVEVFVKPDADRIIIEDNGCGMSRSDFVSHFERISESTKRSSSDVTAAGRPKIGKIGIGFIAANEICEMMEIYSTKLDSTELLHVTINFDEMRKPIEQRRRGKVDIAKADYDGEILEAEPGAHYTTIYLTNVRGAARDAMSGEGLLSSDAKALSLYGLREPSIVRTLTSPPPNSWKDFDLYSQTMLHKVVGFVKTPFWPSLS